MTLGRFLADRGAFSLETGSACGRKGRRYLAHRASVEALCHPSCFGNVGLPTYPLDVWAVPCAITRDAVK